MRHQKMIVKESSLPDASQKDKFLEKWSYSRGLTTLESRPSKSSFFSDLKSSCSLTISFIQSTSPWSTKDPWINVNSQTFSN